MDIAVSRALLRRASDGEIGETFRLNVPGRVMAFGKRDTLADGYPDAVAATQGMGFAPVVRLAGGRAAVFHEGTFAFSWSIPDPDPRTAIRARFGLLSELMVDAFVALGIEAAVGEIPGEYCPGGFSVHHAARIKLMGVGQRLARQAAHIGGVVVVTDSRLTRDALVPVYRALGLEWDPVTAGSLQDVAPAVTMQAAATAIETELGKRAVVEPAVLEGETIQLAERLAPEHVPA